MLQHFSFSGCGFLGIYHLGVAASLQQYVPNLIKDCKIAGASAGSFVACCLITECSIDKCTKYVLDLVDQAESKPLLGPLHPRFNLITGLRDSMFNVLPADAYKTASGRLFISLTRYKDMKNVIVSEYESNSELIDAMSCSGFVPFYCGIIPPTYKGEFYWDGGLSDNQPVFDEPTITVSPFAGETDICPQDNSSNFIHLNICNSSVQFTQENLHRMSIALFPPKSRTLSEIFEQGYTDALRYLQKNGMVNCVSHLNPTRAPIFQKKDIKAEKKKETKKKVKDNFDCRKCKQKIRKIIFSTLPPDLLKVFHSTVSSKDQSILKYICQGKLFPALSLFVTPFIAPVDILRAYLSSFIRNIPQDQQELKNVLKRLRFLFLCFIQNFLYKPCAQNKRHLIEISEYMDTAYSFYCYTCKMDGQVQAHNQGQEPANMNTNKDPIDLDSLPNIKPILPNLKLIDKNLKYSTDILYKCESKEIPLSGKRSLVTETTDIHPNDISKEILLSGKRSLVTETTDIHSNDISKEIPLSGKSPLVTETTDIHSNDISKEILLSGKRSLVTETTDIHSNDISKEIPLSGKRSLVTETTDIHSNDISKEILLSGKRSLVTETTDIHSNDISKEILLSRKRSLVTETTITTNLFHVDLLPNPVENNLDEHPEQDKNSPEINETKIREVGSAPKNLIAFEQNCTLIDRSVLERSQSDPLNERIHAKEFIFSRRKSQHLEVDKSQFLLRFNECNETVEQLPSKKALSSKNEIKLTNNEQEMKLSSRKVEEIFKGDDDDDDEEDDEDEDALDDDEDEDDALDDDDDDDDALDDDEDALDDDDDDDALDDDDDALDDDDDDDDEDDDICKEYDLKESLVETYTSEFLVDYSSDTELENRCDLSQLIMSKDTEAHFIKSFDTETIFFNNNEKRYFPSNEAFQERSLDDQIEASDHVKNYHLTKYNNTEKNEHKELNTEPELYNSRKDNYEMPNSNISLFHKTEHSFNTNNCIETQNALNGFQTGDSNTSITEEPKPTFSSHLIRHISIEYV